MMDRAYVLLLLLVACDRRGNPYQGRVNSQFAPAASEAKGDSMESDAAPRGDQPQPEFARLFQAAPPPRDQPFGELIRRMVVIPTAADSALVVPEEETLRARTDTLEWLDTTLQPSLRSAFRRARWLGFRAGALPGWALDTLYAATDSPDGPVQILASSPDLIVRTRLLPGERERPGSERLLGILQAADRIFCLETPKDPTHWPTLHAGEFLCGSLVEPGASDTSWKNLPFASDGLAVAFHVKKIPALPPGIQTGGPVRQPPKPDPEWFGKPPRGDD
ncbi:MAG: hypothetical protein JW751_28210 [Polyangiaceae bacterium]|nr:hypothetical protein [Polyangiaceae bacterium]